MIRQFHSNDLKALSSAVCSLLRDQPLPPLVAEQIVVPNVGIAKWLRHQIADELGIAADLRLILAREFFDNLVSELSGSGAREGPEHWLWRLMRIVPEELHTRAFAPLAQYLDARPETGALLGLATALGRLYARYVRLRPDWLARWETGGPDEERDQGIPPWQALLWRRLVADAPDRIGCAPYYAAFSHLKRNTTDWIPAPRILVFTLGQPAAMTLPLLSALSERCPVYLFHLCPCQEFWSDLVDEATLARWRVNEPERAESAEVGHPLLSAWGRPGKWQLEQLLEDSDGEIIELYREPSAVGILGELQRDILELRAPVHSSFLQDDSSLELASASSPLREVEALHDYLLSLFDRDRGLRPHQVIVLVPELAEYASSIRAVFSEFSDDNRFIPFGISDVSTLRFPAAVEALFGLLRLPETRFEVSEILALLEVSALRRKFGLENESVENLREWIARAGVRYGFAAEVHPETAGVARYGWRHGLARMLLGLAFEQDAVFHQISACVLPQGQSAETLGRLIDFLEHLDRLSASLRPARSMRSWCNALHQLTEDCFAPELEDEESLRAVAEVARKLSERAESSRFDGEIERRDLLSLLQREIEQSVVSHQFLDGSVTFARLLPYRTVPAKVVCVLGLNADRFPRGDQSPAWDQTAFSARPGDDSPRDEDRYAFLLALLSAGKHLYLSWCGTEERDGQIREASLVVDELRRFLDRYWTGLKDSKHPRPTEGLLRVHPMKPFNPKYFKAGSDLFSYRKEWLAAHGRVEPSPFFDLHLPEPELDVIELTAVQAFFRNPCQFYLERALGIRFADAELPPMDVEPMELGALERWQLKQALLEATLRSKRGDEVELAAESSVELPIGHKGRREMISALETTRVQREALADYRELTPSSTGIDLLLDGMRLSGVQGGLRGNRLLMLKAGAIDGRSLIRFWIAHLALSAAEASHKPSVLLGEQALVRLAEIDCDKARSLLLKLLQIYRRGLSRPLPFFPNSSWKFAQSVFARGDVDDALRSARQAFYSGERTRGDDQDRYVARVFADEPDPLDEMFQGLASEIFTPICERFTFENYRANA